MNRIGKNRKLLLVLNFVIVFMILWSSALVFSHGDDEADESLASEDTSKVVAAPSDSLYSAINEKYQDVRYIFEHSCFDCHSTLTSYPWYYEIPGIKGMIDEDIKEALEHFDLSNDFPFKSKHDQVDLLKDIKEEIEEDEMPLKSYRMMHWGRLIEGARRDSVFEWINASIALLKQAEETVK